MRTGSTGKWLTSAKHVLLNSALYVKQQPRAVASSESMTRIILGAVQRMLDEHGGPVLVALDGPSGAGKSTVAAALAAVTRAVVVPTDDFFSAEITAAQWDARGAPERARDAIDWRRLRRDALEPLRAGRAAEWHSFDFAAGERLDGTYAMSFDVVRRDPAPVIILDGAYSTRPELADLIDLSILIEVPAAVRLQRLAAREAPAFFAAWHARWDAAEAFHFTHVRPPATFDLIVDGMSPDAALVEHDPVGINSPAA
ncbi:MAG: (d)CMP kinase [Gemmatimonadota bacterium]|nr:(d)CMP kinase [Gemmatimonadota bacterium]